MPTICKPKNIQKNKAGNSYAKERKNVYDSARWRKLRAWKFACNPLCERCAMQGKVTPAEDIHHLTSFMDSDDPQQRAFLAYDYNNLMSLCKECHGVIHSNGKREGAMNHPYL